MRFNSSARFNRKPFNTIRKVSYTIPTISVSNIAGYRRPFILEGWTYRKQFSITNPSANFQALFHVYRSSGTDSGYDVYLGTDCETDYRDIRFTDADGHTLLPYWIESYDASSATIWVKLSGESTGYIYYGNTSATSAASGADTFDLYLDCDSTSGWSTNNSSVSKSGDFLRIYTPYSGAASGSYKTISLPNDRYWFEYRLKNESLSGSDTVSTVLCDGSTDKQFCRTYTPAYSSQNTINTREGGSQQGLYTSYSEGTEYIIKIHVNEADSSTGISYYLYDTSYNLLASRTDKAFAYGSPSNATQLAIGTLYSFGSGDGYFRWIRVRKFASTEPTISAWSAVETGEIERRAQVEFILSEQAEITNIPEIQYSLITGELISEIVNTPECSQKIFINILPLYRVPFTEGTSEIQVGETITGATTGATGTVISVSVTSGTWAEGDAEGEILINTLEGVFSNELINGSVSGDEAATATGVTRISPRVISKSVTRDIEDVFATAKLVLDGNYSYTANANYRNVTITMKDHNSVDRVVFSGFIPDHGIQYQEADNTTTLTAYSYSWYLGNQVVSDADRTTVTYVPGSGGFPGYLVYLEPSVIVNTLLGGVRWYVRTGCKPLYILPVSTWGSSTTPVRGWSWRSGTTKWAAIKEICDYTGYVFDVTPDGAIFCGLSNIDTYFGLPSSVTFDREASSQYVLSVGVVRRGTDRFNRVIAKGKRNYRKVNFTGGTGSFAAGQTLTDGGTGAEATIVSVTKISGEWTGTAAGYIIIRYDRTGEFMDSNTIVSSGGGSATVVGYSQPYQLYDEYTYTAETTEVTQEDGELPRERFIELDDNYDSTPLIEAKAIAVLEFSQMDSNVYSATVRDRADLRPWQKVRFLNFPDIPGNWLRIIQITYTEVEGTVNVNLVLQNSDYLLSQQKARRVLIDSDTKAIENLVKKMIKDNLSISDGEVLEVSGEYYTIRYVDGVTKVIAKGT